VSGPDHDSRLVLRSVRRAHGVDSDTTTILGTRPAQTPKARRATPNRSRRSPTRRNECNSRVTSDRLAAREECAFDRVNLIITGPGNCQPSEGLGVRGRSRTGVTHSLRSPYTSPTRNVRSARTPPVVPGCSGGTDSDTQHSDISHRRLACLVSSIGYREPPARAVSRRISPGVRFGCALVRRLLLGAGAA
jgi:hypothetical protein